MNVSDPARRDRLRELLEDSITAEQLAAHHDDIGKRWTATVSEYTPAGRLGDTIIDALWMRGN
jgi:hypothetical protein